MAPDDYLLLGLGALRSHRLRSFLSMLGIAIGIAAVVLLTSIGEGTRRYLISEFTQFGTNVLQVNPGKTETMGIPGILGGTTHKLTIDDWTGAGGGRRSRAQRLHLRGDGGDAGGVEVRSRPGLVSSAG